MSFPSANFEIEIPLPIPFHVLNAWLRRVRILFRQSHWRLQGGSEDAQHERRLNAFDVHHCLLECACPVSLISFPG
jgi:hypothetical protein